MTFGLLDVLDDSYRRSENDVSIIIQETDCCQSLSYRDAKKAQKRHLSFLERVIPPDSKTLLAYISGNTSDYFLSVLVCTSLGARVALLNTRWSATEMASVLQSKSSDESTILLYEKPFETTARKVAERLNHSCSLREIPSFVEEFLRRTKQPLMSNTSPSIPVKDIDSRIDSIGKDRRLDKDALIIFTSGTTSGSKGVRLSHRAILVQALAKLQPPCSYSQSTRLLATTVPFFHVGGLSSILATWLSGGALVFPSKRTSGFDPESVFSSLKNTIAPTTALAVVPAMLHAMQQYRTKHQRYPQVEVVLIGGQSASESLRAFIKEAFPQARVVQTYACSEAASSLTFLPIDDTILETSARGDCVGRPPQHVRLKLVKSPEYPSEGGLIATKGPHVMTGYWRRDRDIGSGIDSSGWHTTSDLGRFDSSGRLYFLGRASDTIRSGGETIMASEVEKVVLQHPTIVECAVFALKDARLGEKVSCAIVTDEHDVPLAELQQWCRSKDLTGYKLPRALFVLKSLPRNSSGKVQKFILTEMFANGRSTHSKL